MRLPRFLAGVLAALLSVALIGGAPAQAVVPGGDPLATTVTGACAGGPGRVSLTVDSLTDGSYRVVVAARGLAEGSRWTVDLVKVSQTSQRYKDFRRVAVDGGWRVVTRFSAPADPEDDVYFDLRAGERGDRRHGCSVLNSPASPVAGLADCNNERLDIIVLARQRDDGATVVRSFIEARLDSPWHLILTATGAAGRQVVEFDDRASKPENAVTSRVVLTGVEDPRLRLVASNKDLGRCFIGLDPPSVMTDASPTLQGLRELGATH